MDFKVILLNFSSFQFLIQKFHEHLAFPPIFLCLLQILLSESAQFEVCQIKQRESIPLSPPTPNELSQLLYFGKSYGGKRKETGWVQF